MFCRVSPKKENYVHLTCRVDSPPHPRYRTSIRRSTTCTNFYDDLPRVMPRLHRHRQRMHRHNSVCAQCRLPYNWKEFDTLAMIYCDQEEAPVVWDYRAHRFLEKQFKRNKKDHIALLFVCHWSQSPQVELVLHSFPHAFVIFIDRCCSIWFDSPEIQDIVTNFSGNVQIVDQPVSMANLIRSRAKFPHYNSCNRCR